MGSWYLFRHDIFDGREWAELWSIRCQLFINDCIKTLDLWTDDTEARNRNLPMLVWAECFPFYKKNSDVGQASTLTMEWRCGKIHEWSRDLLNRSVAMSNCNNNPMRHEFLPWCIFLRLERCLPKGSLHLSYCWYTSVNKTCYFKDYWD